MTTKLSLTQNDTYEMYIDARRFGTDRLVFGNEHTEREPLSGGKVRDWQVGAYCDGIGEITSVDHGSVLEAMSRIAEGTSGANEVTAALVREAVNASHGELPEKLAALETSDHEAILEVAVTGAVTDE